MKSINIDSAGKIRCSFNFKTGDTHRKRNVLPQRVKNISPYRTHVDAFRRHSPKSRQWYRVFRREAVFIKMQEVLFCTSDSYTRSFNFMRKEIQENIVTFCKAHLNLVSSCTNKLFNKTQWRIPEHHLALIFWKKDDTKCCRSAEYVL
jgi:hypothetical protein